MKIAFLSKNFSTSKTIESSTMRADCAHAQQLHTVKELLVNSHGFHSAKWCFYTTFSLLNILPLRARGIAYVQGVQAFWIKKLKGIAYIN